MLQWLLECLTCNRNVFFFFQMDQSISSNELTDCSHRNSPDLIALNSKSLRSSSSSSNLLDIGIFNCLYSESVQTSLQKSLISSSTSDIPMSPVSRVNHSNSRPTNGRKHHSSFTSNSIIQGKSSYKQCVNDQLPKRISNKQREQLSSSHPADIDLISQYKLSSKSLRKKT